MATEYDPNAQYEVRFSRVIQMGAFKYWPHGTTMMRGSEIIRIVQEHGDDAIASAQPR